MEHHTRIGAILDPTTRAAALPNASDDDLIIAAISRNADPIYPGRDESIAALDLALLVLHAKTPNGFERVLREALRWVSAELLINALTELHGRNPRTADLDPVQYLLRMPNGQTAITVCCVELASRKWLRAETELLGRLVAVSTDIAMLEDITGHGSSVTDAARSRLMLLDPLSEVARRNPA
jgi:hypothetical protein